MVRLKVRGSNPRVLSGGSRLANEHIPALSTFSIEEAARVELAPAVTPITVFKTVKRAACELPKTMLTTRMTW